MKTLKILSTDRVEIKYFIIKKKKKQNLKRCKKKKNVLKLLSFQNSNPGSTTSWDHEAL